MLCAGVIDFQTFQLVWPQLHQLLMISDSEIVRKCSKSELNPKTSSFISTSLPDKFNLRFFNLQTTFAPVSKN